MSDTDTHGIPSPDGIADVIETDYEIGQDNFETKIGPFGLDIHNPVFVISGAAIVIFVLYTLLLPEQASAAFKAMFNFTTTNFDWFLIGAADIVVIFALLLIVTPYGSVRLGGDEATPDYTYMGWFAMLFAAGDGHRVDVLRRVRAVDAFLDRVRGHCHRRWASHRLGAAGCGHRGRAGVGPAGHGCHDLPLGAAPLGDLCDCRFGAGAFHL